MIDIFRKIGVACAVWGVCVLGAMGNTPMQSTPTTQLETRDLSALYYKLLFWEKGESPEEVLQMLSRLSARLGDETDDTVWGEICRLRVCCYILQGDYGWAINEVNKLLDAAERPIQLGFSYYALGDIYFNLNLFETAISFYQSAITYFEQVKQKESYLCELNYKIMFNHLLLNQPKQARKSLIAFESICARTDSTNHALERLLQFSRASYNIVAGHLEEARRLMDELEITSDTTNAVSQLMMSMMYVNYYMQKGEPEQAYPYIQDYIKAAGVMYDPHWLIRAFEKKAQIEAAMNDMESACEDYRRVYFLKDSLTTNNFLRQDQTLHLTYRMDESLNLVWEKWQYRIQIIMLVIIALMALGLVLLIRLKWKNKRLRLSRIELEKTNQRIKAGIETKSLFLSNMSHEIRTPLNAISGFSELLISQEMDTELRQQCNEMVQQNSALLMKLLNDVLDLSNLDIQNMNFRFKDCNVLSLCHSIVETVKSIKRTEASVSFETSLTNLILNTDENRLQQVLLNILINATKFTKQGSIVLSLDMADDRTARFTVTDTGIGIAPEMQQKVFTRFEKINEGSNGFGLGLSICKLIVTRFGGEIWIDPDYTEGSRFVFTHPIVH